MISEKGYVTKLGHHCFNSCLVNYLNFKGIVVDEYDIFIKSKGYEIEKLEDKKIIYKVLKNSLEFLETVGIKYVHKTFNNQCDAKDFLIDYVKNEELITVFLNTNTLKYNSAFSHSGETLHCVNVIGVDEKNNKVMISDGYIAGYKGSCYEDWISIDELLLSWENAQFTCFIFYIDDVKESNIRTYDLSKVFSQYFTDNKQIESSLLDEMQQIYDLEDEEMINSLLQINKHIRVGGLIFVRNYFLGIIKKIGLDNSLIDEYAKICRGWNIISSMIIKCSYVKDKSELNTISDKIEELFTQENNIIKSITNTGLPMGLIK